MTIRCASIGCGKRAAMFAEAMLSVEGAELVGAADPFGDAAATHCTRFGGGGHLEVGAMLAATRPDFVSVVTRPNIRLEPIKACIEAGVKAIHCEKPMAISWGEAKAIHQLAAASGVQVTFSHQRRYLAKFETARRLIAEGAIGKLQRLEGCCDNFYDWGTHWFDIFFFLNGEVPAESVIAQADRSEPKLVFDQPVDRSGVAVVNYANGVKGIMFTGKAQPTWCSVRAMGEDGMLEIRMGADKPMMVVTADGVRFEPVDGLEEGEKSVAVAVVDAMRCWREKEICRLDSRYAVAATELIFASYASSRRGGPIVLPLDGDLSLREAFDLE